MSTAQLFKALLEEVRKSGDQAWAEDRLIAKAIAMVRLKSPMNTEDLQALTQPAEGVNVMMRLSGFLEGLIAVHSEYVER
jgi:hypothetical protein